MENCFELPLTRPINVRKPVLFNSLYFITIPGGREAGGIENKANSVQFPVKLPVGTELGNSDLKMTKILKNVGKSQNMHLMTGKVLKIKAQVAQAGANRNLKLLVYHICGIHKHFWVQD